MRRTLAVGLGAAVLAVVMAAPAAARPEAPGPACADISLQATYVDETIDPTLLGPSARIVITTAAPSCPRIRYAVYVKWSNGMAGQDRVGDGTSQLDMTIYLGTTDPWVCVWAESRGKRQFDVAPNSGCLSRTLNDTTARPPAD